MGRRDDIVQAAKLAAERAKSGGAAVGGAAKRGGEAVGGAAKRGGSAVGGAAKRGGDAVGGAAKRSGDAVGAKVQDGREAGGAAIAKGKQTASTAASTAVDKGKALSADLAKRAMLVVPQRLEALGSPTLPLEAKWGMGFGEFLSGIDGVPKALRPTISSRLDKVGSIFISPTTLELDGEAVEWHKVKAITLGSPTDAMSARAAAELVDHLRAVLPRFPGRTFVLRQAAEFVIALGLAGVPTQTGADDVPVQVVTSVKYAGRVRQKEIRPGLFAILLSSMKPELATAAVETSRPFGTVVKIDPSRRAVARAVAVRDLAQRLRKQIASEPEDD
jgi:hypothetical protein